MGKDKKTKKVKQIIIKNRAIPHWTIKSLRKIQLRNTGNINQS